ncbi:MAG: ATP-binding cassette domain-containing protein [Actinomycetota bacterium]
MTTPAVLTDGLTKRYGDVEALRGIDLEVPPGIVQGVLGPNGAGKTTTVGILATLQRPTSGRARVGGHDVVRDAAAVRRIIGLTGQYAAVDEHLTGRENLALFGQLLGLGARDARRRADELLERFALTDAASRRSRTFSGGMRRRLDLAASLIGRPEIVFLDEPTTGLDPRSRLQLWEVVRELVAEGTTILLTTQYLEEADELADHIVVVDAGEIVARGTAEELKARIGGQVVTATLHPHDALSAALDDAALALASIGVAADVDVAARSVSANVADASSVAGVVRALDRAEISVDRLTVDAPSLDDVFLSITGGGSDDLSAAA